MNESDEKTGNNGTWTVLQILGIAFLVILLGPIVLSVLFGGIGGILFIGFILGVIYMAIKDK